jgi:hypothetical protein
MAVRSEEMVVQTAGHFPPSRSCIKPRSNSEDKSRLTDVREGSSKACTAVPATAMVKTPDNLILRKREEHVGKISIESKIKSRAGHQVSRWMI